MNDPHRIDTIDGLREIIGDEVAVARQKIFDEIDPIGARFIAHAPLVFMATCDADGHMDVSPKGDAPGFVEVESPSALLIPDRPGNRLIDGHRNVLANPRVGLIFVIPNVRETYRVNGRAELTRDPEVLARLEARNKPAILATRVFVEEAYVHCGKAMIRSSLWQAETWPEKFKVGLGKQLAGKLGADDKAAADLDAAIERDYVDGL